MFLVGIANVQRELIFERNDFSACSSLLTLGSVGVVNACAVLISGAGASSVKKIAGFINVREELVRSYYKCDNGGEDISRAQAVKWFKVPELEERLICFILSGNILRSSSTIYK